MPRRTKNDGRSLRTELRQCSAVPAATPGHCTRAPEEMRNAISLDWSCYTYTEGLPYASIHLMHMQILTSNFIFSVSNKVLALVFKNQPCVIFNMLEQPTLSQRVKSHSHCLQWQVVLCARKACGSGALALQDAHLSSLGQGLSCGYRLSFHPLQWECLKLVKGHEGARWNWVQNVCDNSSSFGYCWKALQNGVN